MASRQISHTGLYASITTVSLTVTGARPMNLAQELDMPDHKRRHQKSPLQFIKLSYPLQMKLRIYPYPHLKNQLRLPITQNQNYAFQFQASYLRSRYLQSQPSFGINQHY
ncbi:hypothetical protein U1Q18_015321 [Sarracenia purpurea var. burkii]